MRVTPRSLTRTGRASMEIRGVVRACAGPPEGDGEAGGCEAGVTLGVANGVQLALPVSVNVFPATGRNPQL